VAQELGGVRTPPPACGTGAWGGQTPPPSMWHMSLGGLANREPRDPSPTLRRAARTMTRIKERVWVRDPPPSMWHRSLGGSDPPLRVWRRRLGGSDPPPPPDYAVSLNVHPPYGALCMRSCMIPLQICISRCRALRHDTNAAMGSLKMGSLEMGSLYIGR